MRFITILIALVGFSTSVQAERLRVGGEVWSLDLDRICAAKRVTIAVGDRNVAIRRYQDGFYIDGISYAGACAKYGARYASAKAEVSSTSFKTSSVGGKTSGLLKHVGLGTKLDAGTTAVGLSQGFVEGNAGLAGAGSAVPIVKIVGVVAFKKLLIANGVPEHIAERNVESMSWLGACANIMTLAGAEAPPALVVGGICAFVAHQRMKVRYEQLIAQYN